MTDDIKVNRELTEILRVAFEDAWKSSSSAIEISKAVIEKDGIEYSAKLYDPFSGMSCGQYTFDWSEIVDVIKDPSDVSWIHESVSEWISEMDEGDDTGELMMDDDGRVHFRSDLMDQ